MDNDVLVVNTHDVLDRMPLNNLLEALTKALRQSDELEILLENSSLIDNTGKISNSFRSHDISEIFVALSTVLDEEETERVGLCLNTANMLKSIRLSNLIRVETGLKELDETSEMEKYFILSALWCKRIRLGNIDGQYKKCGFTSNSDKCSLEVILNFYKAYLPEVEIELDIGKEDKTETLQNIRAIDENIKIINV